MPTQPQYTTAGAFRTALEARLNERARRDGVDLHRLRRQVAFDRLLARMFDPSLPVDARLDGRTFVKFHVDLGAGDEVLEPLENIEGKDWLGFAGISAVVVPALSIEQHWSEKLHAYTRPREATNSRVRDLVDLVLILEEHEPSSDRVRKAVDATFAR